MSSLSSSERSTSIVESLLKTLDAPNLLAGLGEAEAQEVMRAGKRRTYEAGQPVFSQGEPHSGVLVILEGRVRSYYLSPSGREITLAYWTRGHFVGGPEIFGGGVHLWSGEAARRSELLFLSGAKIRDLVARLPKFSMNLIEALVFKGKCFSALLQLLGTRSARTLLAHLLLLLARDPVRNGADRVKLDVRYSQEELAKMVGATRQWVAASLTRMKQAGLIEVESGHIVVVSVVALAEYAEAED